MEKDYNEKIVEEGIDTIHKEAIEYLKEIFLEGKAMENTKAFSGIALERWTKYCWESVFCFVKKEFEKGGNIFSYNVTRDYISYDEDYKEKIKKVWLKRKYGDVDDFEKNQIRFLKERLDLHIYINDKIVAIEEDRAWVDKPFFYLKDRILRNILNGCKAKLSKNMRVFLVSLSCDVPEIYNCVCDYEREEDFGLDYKIIEVFNLTKRSRRGKDFNYFSDGFCEEEVKKYINSILEVIIQNVQ